MKLYVGIMDFDLFNTIKEAKCTEINFWKPSGNINFKALSKGELFLFKLHSPNNYIVGGGFFSDFALLPSSLAWGAFEVANGAANDVSFIERIHKYKKTDRFSDPDPEIGCIILSSVFYFDEKDWIPAPADWSNKIVQGKLYDTKDDSGAALYEEVQRRLNLQECSYFQETLLTSKMGEGSFKVSVTEAYGRQCAISGEKTLPVLEATHIKPAKAGGPQEINNGLLLRRDYRTLFDRGYITVNKDFAVEVSKLLKEDAGTEGDYASLNGRKLILPSEVGQWPAEAYLEWHRNNIYLG